MRLDLDKVEVFVAVARTGSYGTAAHRLHVTPSAVSHAISKLQESLGCDLVTWRGRRLMLTAKGQDLFAVGARVFDELDEVEHRLGSPSGAVTLHFVLGATIEFGTTVLLDRLQPFLAAHPALHVDFRFANDLNELLLRDEIDLAVDCHPHAHPSVHRTQMFREKYVVVASPAFLKAHPIRSPRDLAQTPVLSLDHDGRWWNNFLQAVAEPERPVLERRTVIDHVRGMINATLAGYGVSLLPKYAITKQLAKAELVALFPKLVLLEDSFCLYQKLSRRDRPANRLVTDFLCGLDLRELGDAIGRDDEGPASPRP